MRKVTFGCANSLDNFIARDDHSVDWLLWNDEVAALMKDYWQKIDTVIMGRKTWEVAMASNPSPDAGPNPYGDMTTYVVSTTLKPADVKGATVIAGDPGEFVRELKAGDGKEICIMGGGLLAAPLLEQGVIDEIGFNIHPVLLGSGVPLFHKMNRQIDLELIECKALKNGCVYVLYRINN